MKGYDAVSLVELKPLAHAILFTIRVDYSSGKQAATFHDNKIEYMVSNAAIK